MLHRVPLSARLGAIAVCFAALSIGTAAAASNPNVQVVGGSTGLAITPAVLPVLASHHITVAPIAPGRVRTGTLVGKKTVVFNFPITGGKVNPKTLVGYIRHSGGLAFSHNGKTVRVGLFTVIIAKHPRLTAAVNLNPAVRVPLLTLDVSKIRVVKTSHRISVLGVRVALTKTAATALNQGLGTKVFAAGLKLGVANVYAKA